MKPLATLAAFLAGTFAAAIPGAFCRPGDWYANLRRPPFAPPNWVFGPVWTLLYIAIATAGWLVWRHPQRDRARPLLLLWAVQMTLNALWTVLFFGLHAPGLALIEIVALLAAIAAFILFALPLVPLAAALFVPYLAWVAFATLLNAAFWRLNPG